MSFKIKNKKCKGELKLELPDLFFFYFCFVKQKYAREIQVSPISFSMVGRM